MKRYWMVLAVVAVLVVAGAYWYASRPRVASSDVVMTTQQPAGAAQAASSSARSTPPAGQPPINYGYPFKDTSMLKLPPGAKVAIYEFEDLECPACGHAYPIVRAAIEHYHVPLIRHDFVLTEIHIWSLDAAITARYLEDSISPKLAEAFRGDVFAAQASIANKDDLARFTANWFQAHGQTMPFVMDPNGSCKAEVMSDRALGDRLNIHSTPCILVVTQNGFTPVGNADQLDQIIKAALAGAAPSNATHAAVLPRSGIADLETLPSLT